MKEKILVAGSLVVLITLGGVLCAVSNLDLYHQFVIEVHAELVEGVHAVWTGVVILFFTALTLGVATALVKLNHARKAHVIAPSKHGPAQAVIHGGQLVQLQSPLAHQTDRVREMKEIMQFAVLMANASKKLAPEVEGTAEPLQLEGPKDILPQVVRYEDVEDEVPQNMSLLGIHPHDGELELTNWENLKMLWVVGSSSSGKSNTVYGKVFEAVKRGAGLLVVDQHAVKADSLARKLAPHERAFLRPVAVKDDDVLAVLQAFKEEFERRVNGAPCDLKIVLICDEMNRMARNDKLAAALREIVAICGQESRGFGMYGWFISQTCAHLKWLRDSAITAIAHKLTRFEEAKLACNDDTKAAKRLLEFKVGRTYIYGVDFDAPMELQQPLYRTPKLDHPSLYPDGDFLPETNGETAGKGFDPEFANRPFELKKMLLDIKKMAEQGMSREKILQSYGLRGDGRNNADLKVVLDVLSSLDDAEEA